VTARSSSPRRIAQTRSSSFFDDRVDEGVEPDIGVVDCVTKQRGIGTIDDDPRIKYASSPVDMTGIGIKLSEYLQEFYETRGAPRTAFCCTPSRRC